jgi:phosphatidate cytidylyltransferase
VLGGAIWFLPPWVTTTLVAVVALVAGGELSRMFAAIGAPLPTPFVAAAAAIAALGVTGFAAPDGQTLLVVVLTVVLAGGAVTLSAGPPEPAALTRAAALVMAPIYVGIPLGIFAWIRDAHGPAAMTWVIAAIAISDSAQYFVGRALGRTKLAPRVSPSKTIEGALGGLFVVAAFGASTSGYVFTGFSPLSGAGLALALALAGIVGDLFESLLKRSAGVKDSSSLIPGHGGVLDRIDSHLFAAPAFYLFTRFLG